VAEDAMHALSLSAISKHYGKVAALADVDLVVHKGSFVCFLGPSGCGKTTLLRTIAGLEYPSNGKVMLEGRDVTDLPAHKRDLGMVFQSLALFPHLDVAANIAYGMRIRGFKKDAQQRKVAELLDLVRLPDIATRHVSQLSGGQRQRVAIARALAMEPRLFLLDEPLSALDAKLHEEMQVELKLLQQQVGVTTIMVTHNQREAMTMADVIVVMRDGRIQQIDEPLNIYRNPSNTFVAEFIGSSNLLQGIMQAKGQFQASEYQLHVPDSDGIDKGDTVTVSVRPEDVHIHANEPDARNLLQGTVELVRDVGQSVEFFVQCGSTRIIAHVQPRDKPPVSQGEQVAVELPVENCVVLKQ